MSFLDEKKIEAEAHSPRIEDDESNLPVDWSPEEERKAKRKYLFLLSIGQATHH